MARRVRGSLQLAETSELIWRNTAVELRGVFGEYRPDASEGDLCELEIASGGVMCGYMARPRLDWAAGEAACKRPCVRGGW